MRHWFVGVVILALFGCADTVPSTHHSTDLIGLGSFALAARYGTPTKYQHQGEYLQLSYGSEEAGCRVIVLVDQAQRVAGWVSTGKACTDWVR